MPESVIKEILSDVFGAVNEKGLIHALDGEFDTKMKIVQKRWDSLEKPYKKVSVVYRWFAVHIAPIICDSMRSELLCNLGLEEEKYTQNQSESLKALVKCYVNFQK